MVEGAKVTNGTNGTKKVPDKLKALVPDRFSKKLAALATGLGVVTSLPLSPELTGIIDGAMVVIYFIAQAYVDARSQNTNSTEK